MTQILTVLGLSILIAGAFPIESAAQTAQKRTNTKTITIINHRAPSVASLNVENASLRQALARLFYNSKVDFVFEGSIPTGLVTAKIKNQPFETALRLVLASSDVPMTYSRVGNVYLIRVLQSRPTANVARNPAPVYVDDGWGNRVPVSNTVPVNPVPPAAPATVGFNIGPGGVGPHPNTGGIQFGAPIGGPPVIFLPYRYGFPPVFNPGFGFPLNGGFGNTGFFFRP